MTAYWDENSKSYQYRNDQFFPIDGRGYGYEGMPHNYGFCFTFNTQFTYNSGQVFSFTGDDDVWVFIDKKLAIDLGGVHTAAFDEVNLDTLGLTQGNRYPLDFFFCERHQVDSHLWFSTSIVLDPCGTDDTDGDGIPDKCDPCPSGDQVYNVWNEEIPSNNVVTFHIDPTNPQSGETSIPVEVDFGDGETGSYDVGLTGLTFSHTYKKSGDYDVTFTSEGVAGCGCKDWEDSISLTCGGNRIAPKCSELPLTPGSSGEPSRKRSF